MSTNIFDLRVSFLQALINKPTYSLSPVELQHFNFGFSVDFPLLKFSLDASDVTIHDLKLGFEIKVELAFLKCQEERSLGINLAHWCDHQGRASKHIPMVV